MNFFGNLVNRRNRDGIIRKILLTTLVGKPAIPHRQVRSILLDFGWGVKILNTPLQQCLADIVLLGDATDVGIVIGFGTLLIDGFPGGDHVLGNVIDKANSQFSSFIVQESIDLKLLCFHVRFRMHFLFDNVLGDNRTFLIFTARKNPSQSVVVGSCDRIELVIVAPCTGNCQP